MAYLPQIIDFLLMALFVAFGVIFFHFNIYTRACRLLHYMIDYADTNKTIIGFKDSHKVGFWGYPFWFKNLTQMRMAYGKYRPILRQIELIQGYRVLYVKYLPIIIMGIAVLIYFRERI
jgi:hypothetical protein